MNKKAVGNEGEIAAVLFMERTGYRIIDTNVRPFTGLRRGEIDIVAWDGNVLCVVEVKTRASRRFDANEAITITKRRQLTRLAQAYMQRHNIVQNECRFDVICVYNREEHLQADFVLTKHAFDPVY